MAGCATELLPHRWVTVSEKTVQLQLKEIGCLHFIETVTWFALELVAEVQLE